MIYVLGGNGFIGSAFARLFETKNIAYEIITKENFSQYKNTSCDILINANGNSKKYLADQYVLEEFNASVSSVLNSLVSLSYQKYIFLSTGDVYPSQESVLETKESSSIDITRQCNYGFHKYLAEQLVQHYAQNWLIFRMGGFVGPGLKKNAIFDMRNNSTLWISLESELQFICTDTVASIIYDLAIKPVAKEIFNIGGKNTARLSDIHRDINSTSTAKVDAKKIKFELATEKLEAFMNASLPSSVDEIRKYINKNVDF
jgi:nucleoside-diphosphate-sugar epimerase